jgi:putrescine transport system permease protein
MVAGWLLSFTLSLDDLVISSFTAGPGSTTLPMLIFSKVKMGMTPDINALASIIVGVVTVGVCIGGYLMQRAEKQREKDIQLAIAANK